MMPLISAARAHAELCVLQAFVNRIALIEEVPLRLVLKKLCDLFALASIESPWSIGAIGFFEDGYIKPPQLRKIRAIVNKTLDELVPDAIGLTDAWSFSDNSLGSALGRYDGNAYETLLAWTRQIPLNEGSVNTGRIAFDTIKPLVRAKL
jgi:acyl-CoA oxidase